MLHIKDTIKYEQIKSISLKDKLSLKSLFNLFNIASLCKKNGMLKHKGYAVSELLELLFLFPFMSIVSVHSFYVSRFNEFLKAQKDTLFRLKNNEYFNWRNLNYLFAKRYKKLSERNADQQSDTAKCLILDDTVIPKVGMQIESIGKVFDHVIQRSVLGFKLLLLTFWDGNSLIPLDFSCHCERGKNKKYPFGLLKRHLKKRFTKQRDKSSAGYKRSKELYIDKISNAIALLKRAVKHGFIPEYVLTDSWFSVEKVIKSVRQLKKGIIHFLGMVKMDKRHYNYRGQQLNAKELQKLLKPMMKRAKHLRLYYIEAIVSYSDIGEVKLFLTRFSKRSKWRLILTTDLDLSFHQAIKIYNTRWTIEVLFKECKQLLNLGKCQSNDFDAQIADATISLITYMMLSFHKKIHCYTTLGSLFAQYKEQFVEATVFDKLWNLFVSIQLKIADILELDFAQLMRVIFQTPKLKETLTSLSKIFFEDDFFLQLNNVT